MSEANQLEGRVALVTGAGLRLGRHLALTLGRAGADVFVHYNRNGDSAAEVVAELEGLGRRAWAVQADFLKPGAIEEMFRQVSSKVEHLSIVVNNVGNYLVKPLLENTPSEWTDTLQANLVAPFEVVLSALPLFPSEGAAVVNIGYAGVENLSANEASTAYQASKTGLLILTKSLARALGSRNVRVNMVSPGQLENSVDLPANVGDVVPLGRAGTLEDVAATVLFLLQPDSYINGVNIDVAGGYRL